MINPPRKEAGCPVTDRQSSLTRKIMIPIFLYEYLLSYQYLFICYSKSYTILA